MKEEKSSQNLFVLHTNPKRKPLTPHCANHKKKTVLNINYFPIFS